MLRWTVTPFAELSAPALYEMLTLRSLVFVVEQKCVYLDCDGVDHSSLHLSGRESSGRLVAYARLVPPGRSYAESSIGRVVSHPDVRGAGVGKALMTVAIAETRKAFGAGPIRIGAQLYLTRFYGDFGFARAGDEYLEDGIPHVHMTLR